VDYGLTIVAMMNPRQGSVAVRHVVITGGGTGIGYAVAEAFAADGDDVTITGRRSEVLDEVGARLGARAVAFDASDPAAVTAALDTLPEAVDVLVNNAGGNTDSTVPMTAPSTVLPRTGGPTSRPTSCRPSWSPWRCHHGLPTTPGW
jgi:NAD(P)-dependent dehydrogenase (short-subunit alcohol dehydrogenase family)